MKKDAKGKEIPECRVDEVQLSMKALADVCKKTDGAFDRNVETNWLLRDIDMSLAILVDMCGLYFAGQLNAEVEALEPPVQ